MFVKRNTVNGVIEVSYQKIADEFGTTRGKVRHIMDKFYSENLLSRPTSAQSWRKVGATSAQADTENQNVTGDFRPTSAQSWRKVGATSAQSSTNITDIKARGHSFGEKLIPYVKQYGKEMIRAFFDYWTEVNDGGKKMRFEKETTFDLSKRLARWYSNDFGKKKSSSLPVGMNIQGTKNKDYEKGLERWNR